VDGCQHHFVTVSYLCEREAGPSVLAGRELDVGAGFTLNVHAQPVSQPEAVDPFDKFCFLMPVVVINDLGNRHIGRKSKGFLDSQYSLGRDTPIIVYPFAVVEHFAFSVVHNVVEADVPVLKGGHVRSQFEGGTRVHCLCQGIVEGFVEHPGGPVPTQIHDGLDLSGGYLHDDNSAVVGLMLDQGFPEGCFGDILYVNVY